MPISSSTGQHLVDPQNVEGVDAYTQVEGILSRGLGDILVGTDTSSLQRLRRKLLVLVRNEMAAEWEFVDRSTFAPQIKYTNLLRRNETKYIDGTADTLGSGTPRLYRDLG